MFAPTSTAVSSMCWSTNIKTPTSHNTPSSAHSRSIIPTSASPGDPDQSIYGWRGANLSNILEFEHDYPGCRVVKLERNYRSTKNILSVADHLIRFNRNRKPKALLTENPRGSAVELTIFPRETDEAEGVAGKIASLVREGEYGFSDIAVFCRVTALTRPFEQAFRAARIPYQVVGGVSFYERAEVKDVMAYLNLLTNPKDDNAFTRVVNVPPRGLGKTSIDHLTDGGAPARDSPAGDGPPGHGRSPRSRTRPPEGWRNSPG